MFNIYKGGRPIATYPNTGIREWGAYPEKIASQFMERGYYTHTHAFDPYNRVDQQELIDQTARANIADAQGAQDFNILLVPAMHIVHHGALMVTDKINKGGPRDYVRGCAAAVDAGITFSVFLDIYDVNTDVGTDAPLQSKVLASSVPFDQNFRIFLDIPQDVKIEDGQIASVRLAFDNGPTTNGNTWADVRHGVHVMLGVTSYDHQIIG